MAILINGEPEIAIDDATLTLTGTVTLAVAALATELVAIGITETLDKTTKLLAKSFDVFILLRA